MTKRIVTVLLALASSACVKEISSDERLERATRREEVAKGDTVEAMTKFKCDDVTEDLSKARDEKRSEEERLVAYGDIYEKLKQRSQKFDEAMTRNPDLAFQEGSGAIVAARDQCVQSTADVKLEMGTMVNEVMQLLVVDDVRGSQPVKVARINYEVLRNSIEKLELEDREAMFQKINNAEKQVDVKAEPRKRNK